MEKKIKRVNIQISDNQRKNIEDQLNMGGEPMKPHGRVRIYSRPVGGGKLKLEEDTSNLIVYRGRNWLLQRAFNTDLNVSRTGWKDRFISWFGLGTGGATGDPLVASSPDLADYELGSHGTISPSSSYVTVNSREYHAFDSSYPKFLHDPDVDFSPLDGSCTSVDSEDSTSYKCDGFLIGLVRVTVTATEANNGGGGDYQDLSEAGLFVSPSSSLSYGFSSGDMEIFARVNFSTIRKTSERELLFSWLIFF